MKLDLSRRKAITIPKKLNLFQEISLKAPYKPFRVSTKRDAQLRTCNSASKSPRKPELVHAHQCILSEICFFFFLQQLPYYLKRVRNDFVVSRAKTKKTQSELKRSKQISLEPVMF